MIRTWAQSHIGDESHEALTPLVLPSPGNLIAESFAQYPPEMVSGRRPSMHTGSVRRWPIAGDLTVKAIAAGNSSQLEIVEEDNGLSAAVASTAPACVDSVAPAVGFGLVEDLQPVVAATMGDRVADDDIGLTHAGPHPMTILAPMIGRALCKWKGWRAVGCTVRIRGGRGERHAGGAHHDMRGAVG